jgi:hypothetical protein
MIYTKMRKKKLNLGKRLERSEREFTCIVDHLLCYFKEIKKKFLLEEFSQTPHMQKITNKMNRHTKLSKHLKFHIQQTQSHKLHLHLTSFKFQLHLSQSILTHFS